MAKFRVFFHPAPSPDPQDGQIPIPPAIELPAEADLFLPWLRRRLGLGQRGGAIVFSGLAMEAYPREGEVPVNRRSTPSTLPPQPQLAAPEESSFMQFDQVSPEPEQRESQPSVLPDNSWLDEDWAESNK